MALLLGENGRGFELARRLESCGVWRAWLGEAAYPAFAHFLASPSLWDSFLAADGSKSRAQLQLQLRARALLFDKASLSLFLPSLSPPPSSLSPAHLNPAYLQLHGDDVYFSLEEEYQSDIENAAGPIPSHLMHTKTQSRSYGPSGGSNVGSKTKDELPKTWYSQRMVEYRTKREHKIHGEREPMKRTAEGMSEYLTLLDKQKKRRMPFKEDRGSGFSSSTGENNSYMHHSDISEMKDSTADEDWFLPELMFPYNCVPENAIGPINREKDTSKLEFYGILDTLPPVTSRSAAMYERFGIKPDYLGMGSTRSKYRRNNVSGMNGSCLSEEQAAQMSRKLVARVLSNGGLGGATEVSLEVLSQFLSCHIGKLGRTLKVLTDNYKKQSSAVELLKMFLQIIGHGNMRTLADYVKHGTKAVSQTQNQVQGLPQNSSSLLQVQQMQRQMPPHMQMIHPQNLAFQQQQWEKLRKRQSSTPHSPVIITSDQPMVEVKMESPMELPMDSGTLASVNRQLQFRQMAMANHPSQLGNQMAVTNHHSHSGHQMNIANNLSPPGHQLKSMASVPVSHVQSPGMVSSRPQPVKVEGFQELMGGDAKSKHDPEEHRLTSPSK